jgi:hypothetical protein
MLKIILIALAVIAVVLVVVIVMQPGEFRVERSATIAASPPVVFAQVNDFHKWAWNPWGKIDPAMQQSYEGAPFGTGAVYSWVGNKDVGAGRMTIIESRPSELIRIKMEFFKPFAATDTAEFTFTQESNQTAVTWSMSGTNNFFAKAFHLFINMDKMIGDQFVKGLTDMKSQAEAAAN